MTVLSGRSGVYCSGGVVSGLLIEGDDMDCWYWTSSTNSTFLSSRSTRTLCAFFKFFLTKPVRK